MESACNPRPTALAAARLQLETLAKHAEELLSRIDSLGANQLDADPENQQANPVTWWARAFAGQCQAALDELTLLVPSPIAGIDEIPTLRELAIIGNDLSNYRIMAIEKLAAQSDEFSKMQYDFLFDKDEPVAGHWIQRRQPQTGRQLLRPAGFRSEALQFRCDRTGTVAAGELVCPWAPAHNRRRRADSRFMERFDVRVPNADAGNADVSTHAAR